MTSKHWGRGLSPKEAYTATADDLVQRILALIPEHPEILSMESVVGLLHVPGFKCDDLSPSLAQASWAWAKAKKLWEKENPS